MRVEVVSNTILKFGLKNGYGINHLKLQKLLYFLNGEYILAKGHKLIDEHFESYEYGPVITKIYDFYKGYGGRNISGIYMPSIEIKTGNEDIYAIPEHWKDYWDVINLTWTKYGKLDGAQLSTLAHAKGTPWTKNKFLNEVICPTEIKKWFQLRGVENVIYE